MKIDKKLVEFKKATQFTKHHCLSELFKFFVENFDIAAGNCHVGEKKLVDMQSPMVYPGHHDKVQFSYVIVVPVTGWIFIAITKFGFVTDLFEPDDSFVLWRNELKRSRYDHYQQVLALETEFETRARESNSNRKDLRVVWYKVVPGMFLGFNMCTYYHATLTPCQVEKLSRQVFLLYHSIFLVLLEVVNVRLIVLLNFWCKLIIIKLIQVLCFKCCLCV